MASALPAGRTFFDGVKRSFTNVPMDADKDNAIATTEFLEAAEALTTLFDVLGSVAFTPVKSDMLGNIKKIRERQLAAPLESSDLQSLVRHEIASKKHTAAEGLLWLVRGLSFTATALEQNLANDSEELSASFRNAYAGTLKPHHSFLVKPIFSAAMSATPYRKDFYRKLGDDPARVERDLRAWLAALQARVRVLQAFQESKAAKW
ncbi:MAG: hypothetical protein M1826_004628 [Phylliscum demangeonii]|nr:MAG: hypothetical protein M1826_004628 [Phylliscum demangeonii]